MGRFVMGVTVAVGVLSLAGCGIGGDAGEMRGRRRGCARNLRRRRRGLQTPRASAMRWRRL